MLGKLGKNFHSDLFTRVADKVYLSVDQIKKSAPLTQSLAAMEIRGGVPSVPCGTMANGEVIV